MVRSGKDKSYIEFYATNSQTGMLHRHLMEAPKDTMVDHINGDRMDDRIENLQKISRRYNNIKDKPSKNMIIRKCPVCNDEFIFEKRNIAFRPNPCCSRKCAGIKSHKK